MDALKKAAEKVTGGNSANSQVHTQPHGQPSGAGGQQDYVDKGKPFSFSLPRVFPSY